MELGEARESAVIIGLDFNGLYAGAYAFNGDIDESGDDDEIKCFGLNAGYAFENETFGLEAVAALAYQGSDEALALELPEERYLGSFGIGLIDGLSLAVEYAHDEDYDEKDGGTGESADTVTLQMTLEF